VPALTGCGGSTDDSSTTPPAAVSQAPTADVTTPADATTSAQGSPTQGSPAQGTSASVTWPQGTDEFTLNVCTSIGEHTIQGGGDSGNGELDLSFDANLLESGDTGTLTISQTSDMSVVYDADVTALTVNADGSFTGSGEDASKAPFTITGSCEVTW
jgi:hypothetical protein